MRAFILFLALLIFASEAFASEPSYLYKTKLVQAAPGKILPLIELYKTRMASFAETGDQPPLWMRHSQGDKWDLLLLFPMGSYAEYYHPDRMEKRKKVEHIQKDFQDKFREHIAWQEDLFVYGPPLEDLRKSFANGGFFHVEIFQSLAGKHAELYKQREMENVYLKTLNRPQNFIFVRDQGAGWDLFTIGVYRDIKHYAESADIDDKDEDAAVKKAGFAVASQIGPYLRTLISAHHDTLAVAIR